MALTYKKFPKLEQYPRSGSISKIGSLLVEAFQFLESRKITKWLSDKILALGALIVFSPRIIKTYRNVKRDLGSPVIYKQERIGRDGKPFQIWKFRTMTNETDADGNLLPDKQRFTPYGKHLSETGMDELPQLWNIIKGDMSVVGWRPRVAKEMELFGEKSLKIIYNSETKPGLIGPWQNSQIGTEKISFEEMVKREVHFVENAPSFLRGLQYIFEASALLIRKKRNHKPQPNGKHSSSNTP